MGWPRTTTVFPEPTWWNGDPPPDEPVPCKACNGAGELPGCEVRGEECSCFGLARTHCGVICRACDGRGWL